MGSKNLNVVLLANSPNPEAVAAMGARLCYSGSDIGELSEKVASADQAAFIKKLVDMGHLSPIEHVSFTFGVEGVSRALLAQITRHRIASFSVQSQRYVKQSGNQGINYVIPPSIAQLGADSVKKFEAQMDQMRVWYDEWCDILGSDGKEDARFVLPNACETKLVMTMNARELQHMFAVRCCERAQWEIRAMAWAMLGHCLNVAPQLFETAGPSCVCGACGEGAMSCARPSDVRTKAAELKALVGRYGDEDDFARILCEWCNKNIR